MTESNAFLKGNIIDGKAVAAQLRTEIAVRVQQLKEQYGKVCKFAALWLCSGGVW
jgi:hypothetical protein